MDADTLPPLNSDSMQETNFPIEIFPQPDHVPQDQQTTMNGFGDSPDLEHVDKVKCIIEAFKPSTSKGGINSAQPSTIFANDV